MRNKTFLVSIIASNVEEKIMRAYFSTPEEREFVLSRMTVACAGCGGPIVGPHPSLEVDMDEDRFVHNDKDCSRRYLARRPIVASVLTLVGKSTEVAPILDAEKWAA